MKKFVEMANARAMKSQNLHPRVATLKSAPSTQKASTEGLQEKDLLQSSIQSMLSYRQTVDRYLDGQSDKTELQNRESLATNLRTIYFQTQLKASQNGDKVTLDPTSVPELAYLLSAKLEVPNVCSGGTFSQKILTQADPDKPGSYYFETCDLIQIEGALSKLSATQTSVDAMRSLRLQKAIQANNQLNLTLNTLMNLRADLNKAVFQNIHA